MNTPICDFVRRYAEQGHVRLHMPGHKGRAVLGPEALDLTEIPGADVLYAASGIIRESEDNAAALAFYRHWGFEELSREPGARGKLYLMEKKLRGVGHGLV